jgi:NAD(P)H-flavin reductase
MVFQTFGIVGKNERLQSIYFLLEIDCPSIANRIRPGQFVMLKVSEVFIQSEKAFQCLQKLP